MPTRSSQVTSVVAGYFTGTYRWEKFGPEKFRIYEFEVLAGWRARNAEDMCVTLATKKDSAKLLTVKPISDKRPHGVIVASVPYFRKGKPNLKGADSVLKRLAKKGVNGLTVHPSTAFARLACCYTTVLAGRYPSKKLAAKWVKELKRKRVRAYYRKLF